jgi:Domain of unknown function (DUF5916)
MPPLRAIRRLAAVALLIIPPSLLTAAAPPAPPPDAPAPPGRAPLPKRVYHATRLAGPPPRIDGRLDDACWSQGEWTGSFTQREPHEGQPGSQPTELKILYDGQYVYAAIRAHDSALATLPRRRGQRDEIVGDVVGVNFDSYFDKRTGFEFDLTSGGGKIDLVLKNDGWDTSWDAVWDGKVATEPGAWTAEFRIPLSQLRYGGQREQVWGLHSWRWIDRLQEESDWQLLPMDSPGFVYSFGELRGIRDLPPSRRIEMRPYALGKYATTAAEAGNPYRHGADTDAEAGLDAKIGLASNLTLDLTVNPDFGQVEADPSEVNLTTYETFFAEKRPFFLEGKTIFESGIDEDVLFYSRRIGHAPSYDPPTTGFKQAPASTRILGAAKLTGKTPAGLAVGIIEGVTDREVADITEDGIARRQTVEPLTNYAVVRVQQDLDQGNTVAGGILTATARSLRDDALAFLPRTALTGGLDFLHYWDGRAYVFRAQAVGSREAGSPTAIQNLMSDPVHNYQRPDAPHLGVNAGATTLDGTGGQVRIGRESGGRWRYFANVDWRSPGLELNDLGYLRTADVVHQSAQVQYFDTSSGRLLRRRDLRLEETGTYDFGGEFLQQELEFHADLTFNNKCSFWSECYYGTELLDTRVLRGGPALRMPAGASTWIGAATDGSKAHRFQLEFGQVVSLAGRSRTTEIAPQYTARLFDNLLLQVRVDDARHAEDLQYVATAAAAGTPRYVMGRMDQHTLSATLRLDFNFTPELSLSYYGSPFVSTGRFTDFKLVTQPRAARYADRFRRLDGLAAFDAAANRYQVADPAGAFAFANPDFSWRELRSNLVLRWEYRAGSTLYVVWTQNRADAGLRGDFSAPAEYRRLFRAHPDNTFLVKLSYWFSI